MPAPHAACEYSRVRPPSRSRLQTRTLSPAGDEDALGALTAALMIQRSQIAFARGAWTGVLIIRLPAAVKTASKASVYLAPRSLIRNFKPSARAPRSHERAQHGIHVQEIDREDPGSLGAQELAPGGPERRGAIRSLGGSSVNAVAGLRACPERAGPGGQPGWPVPPVLYMIYR